MKSQVVVAGASPHDLLLYPTQTSSDQENRRIFQTVKSERGARLIADFLRSALDEQTFTVHGPATFPATEEDENCLNSIIELEVASDDIRHQIFRVKHAQDIYTQPIWLPPAIVPGKGDRVSALVLQDADGEFTNCENAVDVIRSIIRKSTPDFIIYRMISPLGGSQIWDAVRPSSHGLDEHLATDKLVVVVSADDLRADGVELGYSMSWEKTCEDFVSNLGANGQVDTLVTCAHLVVLFGCDGVIYHRGRQMAQPTLFFDPQSEEGGHERRHGGRIPGYMEAFVANLTAEIAESPDMNLENAIRRGLSEARRLTRMGYRSTDLHEWPKYPVSEIMRRDDDLQSSERALITISIPAENISQGKDGEWSILQHNIGDPVLMAHYIVVEGVLSAAQWIPIAQFGELAALDRVEIESFRAMFNAINTYMSSEQTKPLNFGIFGARGSGKSFAAVQVASSAAMANGRQVQRFDVYLSPTSKTDDLVNALNAIRDCTLSGRLPIVYFNGFDNPIENIPFG